MCSPVALAVAGTAFSAFSQYQSGKSQAAMAKQEAANNQKVAEYNAKVTEMNSEQAVEAGRDALSRGANDAAAIQESFRKSNATARAKAASTGLLVDQGQYADLFADGSAMGEFNAMTALNNAEREAYGYKLKATDYTAQARNIRLGGDMGVANAQFKADNIMSNTYGQIAGTLVSGAARSNGFGAFNNEGKAAGSTLPWQRAGYKNPKGGFYY